MDSGNNSGSIQSSSGGSEEYNSTPNTTTNYKQILPPRLMLNNPSSSHFFDPPFPCFSTCLVNSSSNLDSIQSNIKDPIPSIQLRSDPVARNPRKRTRASRKTPTTVLTTDTSNFKAMVQEFTGVPAPPFSSTSYSRRSGLFNSFGSSSRTGNLPQPSFLSSSSLMLNNGVTDTSGDYQLPQSMMSNVQNQIFLQSFLQDDNSTFGAKSQGSIRNEDQLRNLKASSSNFQQEKGLESIARGGIDGTIDSWICSSD